MKEFLLRASEHAGDITRLLNSIDRNAVAGGRFVARPHMIADVLTILTGDALRLGEIVIANDGTIRLNAVYGGMTLAYTLKILQFSVANGAVEGRITYAEQRRGGGIGGAFLGFTGKSGLAVALAKYPGIKVTDDELRFSTHGVPRFLRAVFHSASPEGVLFRVS
ncbi:MAG: hypothetical protein E7452_04510 [Ruminococcaceae bacterium]|nr:hypothetical protein [Oscillospiraceae bacterium]